MANYVRGFWRGERAKRAMREAARVGTKQAGDLVVERAREIVPFDEGTLSNSGTAEAHKLLAVTEVSFNMDYAVDQHENLFYRHPNGRQAKYLENPLFDSAKDIREIISGAVRRRFGGNTR